LRVEAPLSRCDITIFGGPSSRVDVLVDEWRRTVQPVIQGGGLFVKPRKGLSTLAFLATVIGAFLYIAGRGHRLLLVSGLVFAVVTCSPIDVTYLAVPGKLRVVPFVRGLPGPALREQARRGEVVLGGCLASGLEPRWLLVW
jgi:hypothetical protein